MWVQNNLGMFEAIQEEQKALTQDVEVIEHYKKVRVYPFRIVSGFQTITKAGETDLITNINKEGQYANFYTGNNQITIVGEGSTTLNANHDIHNPNNIVETFTVGRYIDLLATDEGLLNKSNNLTTVNLYGTDYTTTETHNSISLFANCDPKNPHNKQWSFIQKNEFNRTLANSFVPTDYDVQNYVYLILDPRYQSFQWLRIKNVCYYYNNETREPISALIEFETINNDFTNTGKSILQYFQHGVASESYAFPLETYDKDGNIITTLDPSHIQTDTNQIEGIDSVQLDHLSGYALSSVGIFGRVTEKQTNFIQQKNGSYQRTIRPPQMLFLLDSLRIVESPFINRLPVQNVYAAYNMINDVNGVYSSFKDAFSVNQGSLGGYNLTPNKTIVTGMRPTNGQTGDTVKATNALKQSSNSTYHTYTTGTTQGMGTPNGIQPVNQSDYVFGVPSFTASSEQANQVNVAQFLNQNHIINGSIEELTTNYTESTKYTVADTLGLIGGIFEKYLSGLNFGGISAKTLAMGQTYNVLLPCAIVNGAEAINALNADHKTNALPLDYFTDDKASKALPVDSNFYTAYRFSLTHLFSTSDYSDDDVNGIDENNKALNYGKGFNGVWDTVYIGQTTDETGRLLLKPKNGANRALNVDIYKIKPQPSNSSYLIDWVSIKGIGSCDRRVSMYKNENNKDVPKYQLIAQTKSKVKQNITLGADSGLFNYFDEFNTFGRVTGPVNPPAPQPPSEAPSDVKNKIIKVNNQVLYDAQTLSDYNYTDFNKNIAKAFNVSNSNPLLGNDKTNSQTFKSQELQFQNLSRISNLYTKFTQNYSSDNQNPTFTYNQSYNVNDVIATYQKDDGTQNETFNNLTNLATLTFLVYLNLDPKNPDAGSTFKIPVKLERNNNQTGDLDNLLKSLAVTKTNNTATFNFSSSNPINTPNDLSNFMYPMVIFGDYISSNMGTETHRRVEHGQTRYTYDGFCSSHRGNAIINPVYYFNDSNLMLNLGSDALSNFTSSINLTDAGGGWLYDTVPYNYGTATASLPVDKFGFANNTQQLPQAISQAMNYVTSNNNSYKMFQNYKPSFTKSNYTVSFNYDLTVAIDNVQQTLSIKLHNITVTITMSGGSYDYKEALKSFSCNIEPVTNLGKDTNSGRTINTGNGLINPIDINQGFKNIENNHASQLKSTNFTAHTYKKTEFNGSKFVATVGSKSINTAYTQKQSRVSPTFLLDDEASTNWSSGINLTPEQIGNYNIATNGVNEINNVAKANNAPSLIYKQDGSNVYEVGYPLTLGTIKSSLLEAIPPNTINSGVVPFPVVQSYDIQFDPSLKFQPIFGLDIQATGLR